MKETTSESNIHIDRFIEKISGISVSPEDISDYLDYSIQFQSSDNIDEKLSLLDTLFLKFRIKYPNLSQDLEEDISQVYLNFLNFGNTDYNSINVVTDKIIQGILDRFQNRPYEGTFFDLGKEFGLIIGRYLTDPDSGLREVDFMSGFKYGFEIYKG